MHSGITVIIQDPQTVVWRGTVSALASENSEGPFSIYEDHANFMTVLEAVPLTLIADDGSEIVHELTQAVLVYTDNVAHIYVQPSQSVTN